MGKCVIAKATRPSYDGNREGGREEGKPRILSKLKIGWEVSPAFYHPSQVGNG